MPTASLMRAPLLQVLSPSIATLLLLLLLMLLRMPTLRRRVVLLLLSLLPNLPMVVQAPLLYSPAWSPDSHPSSPTTTTVVGIDVYWGHRVTALMYTAGGHATPPSSYAASSSSYPSPHSATTAYSSVSGTVPSTVPQTIGWGELGWRASSVGKVVRRPVPSHAA